VRPNKLQYFGAFICHLLIININKIFGPVSSCQAGKSHFCCLCMWRIVNFKSVYKFWFGEPHFKGTY